MKKLLLAISLVTISVGAFAQGAIVNGAFDTWAPGAVSGPGAGSENPTSWKTTNDTINAMILPFFGQGNVTKETTGTNYFGAAAVRMRSKTYTIGAATVKCPAVIVSGTAASITITPTFKVVGGYAFSARPDSITGYMIYNSGAGTDTALINVQLTKWNTTTSSRDIIGSSVHKQKISVAPTGGYPTYFGDSITYNYATTLGYGLPDTCTIIVMSSTSFPAIDTTSFLILDSLKFRGIDATVAPVVVGPGIHEISSTPSVTLFPNPASGELNLHVTNADHSTFKLFNILGQEIMETRITNQNMKVNVSNVLPGVYIYRLVTDEGAISKSQKLIISK